MDRPSSETGSSLRAILESDTAFYVAVGLALILIFLVGLGILAVTRPGTLGRFELVGFVAGFFLFMTSYFVAMAAYRLLPG